MANTTGLGDTIYAAVKKALEDKNGGGSGGGGSSDFTTAEVSITFNIEADEPVVLPTITVYPPQVPLPPTAGIGEFVETDTTTVILYKGMCEGWYSGSGTVSTSGNVEWDSAGKIFDISGDCTITIEDETH